MEVNTSIAESIHAVDQYAQYDAACKRVLSEKIILAWILKSCLEEYRDYTIQDIAEKYIEGTPQVSAVPVGVDETNRIRGLPTEDATLTEGTVTYDIRFRAIVPKTGERVQMIVNVEAQNDFYPGYPLIRRGIYYCGRLLSSQDGVEFEHSQYQKLKKVTSIWICTTPPMERCNTITRYRLAEENLVGDVKETASDYDLLSVVMVCLGGPVNGRYAGLLRLLHVLLSSEIGEAEKKRILEGEFGIPVTETLETEVNQMCNLSQGVREEGRMEGRVEGRMEGREETRIDSIRNLMANTGWTAEKAMKALGIPEADRPRYANLLQKQ